MDISLDENENTTRSIIFFTSEVENKSQAFFSIKRKKI
ncbi:Conserved hypothetical protein [Prochlorococcus marinus str. MIT 9312]|uniref:Uncharacterized protein n=1 Tax=Prochlorococcus marinus (strain MIT 9312) TaxID=74546 RepID=A7FAF8_PROM9|nr:Conserved hypothetical protein [Prochlorococcus marinus str. MIT 9312]